MGRRAKGEGLFSKNRVREFREKLGMTQTELSEISGISGSRLSRIELSKRPVKIDDLKTLAPFLRTTANALHGDDGNDGQGNARVETVVVSSNVESGLWTKRLEWPEAERFEIRLPKLTAYPDAERHGSIVKGDSMSRVYPEGSVIVWVPFGEIGEPLMPGRHYVIVRHGVEGAREQSVRTFARDHEGRELFMPESDNVEHKPISLGASGVKVEVAGRVITSIGARAGL